MVIRRTVKEKIGQAGVVAIEISRTAGMCRVMVRAARPGLIIGRGGQGAEDLKKAIEKALRKLGKERTHAPQSVNLSIEELRRSEPSALLTAQQLAWELEKRMPFRRLLKKTLELLMQNRDVLGAKIRMAGRLGYDRVTVRNLKVLAVDMAAGKLIVSGAVPGGRGTLLEVVSSKQ